MAYSACKQSYHQNKQSKHGIFCFLSFSKKFAHVITDLQNIYSRCINEQCHICTRHHPSLKLVVLYCIQHQKISLLLPLHRLLLEFTMAEMRYISHGLSMPGQNKQSWLPPHQSRGNKDNRDRCVPPKLDKHFRISKKLDKTLRHSLSSLDSKRT